MSNDLTIHVEQRSGELSSYDIARHALALAVTVDEVLSVRDQAERMKLYGKQAGDTEMLANAMALITRSKRRLGEVLIEAIEAGQISRAGGRPKKGSDGITLAAAGIPYKLSHEAQKLAAFDERDFEAVVEKAREKIRAGGAVVINPVKDLNTQDKQLRRAIKLAQMAERERALPQGRFQVFLADPEWPDEDVWSEAGKDRAPDNHYPTSSVADIAARPVIDIAADNAVLGLWITMRHLARGSHLTVLDGWGFEPRAILIWDKVVAGNGYWVRNRVEALVIAVRGTMPAPAPGSQWEDLIAVPKTVHSRKPDWAHEWFEEFYPGLRRIELNARRARAGWALWGNEAPEDDNESRAKPVVEAVAGEAMSEGAAVAASPGTAETGSRLAAGRTADANVGGDATAGETEVREAAQPALPGAPNSELRQDGPVEAAERVSDSPSADALPPGEPVDLAGGGALSLAGQSYSPEAGNDTGAGSVLDGGTEAAREDAGEVLPVAAELSGEQINAIIAEAYAAEPFPGIAWLEERTGLKGPAIKKRASRAGLGDQARQIAVSQRPNAERSGVVA